MGPKWGFSKILMMVGCSAHKMGLLNQFQFLKLKFFSKYLCHVLLKGLKPKNKGHTNFYECCDFTKKVYLMYTTEPLEVFLVSIIMCYLSCPPFFTLKYSQFFSPRKYSKKIFHCPMIFAKNILGMCVLCTQYWYRTHIFGSISHI